MFPRGNIAKIPRGEGSRSSPVHVRPFIFGGSLGGLQAPFWSSFGCLWGSPWEPLGRLGSSLGTSGAPWVHFGRTLLVLRSPWWLLGCTLAPNLVTLGANLGPEGRFCMLLGDVGCFLMVSFAGVVQNSLFSLHVLCYPFSLLSLLSSFCLSPIGVCLLFLCRFAQE